MSRVSPLPSPRAGLCSEKAVPPLRDRPSLPGPRRPRSEDSWGTPAGAARPFLPAHAALPEGSGLAFSGRGAGAPGRQPGTESAPPSCPWTRAGSGATALWFLPSGHWEPGRRALSAFSGSRHRGAHSSSSGGTGSWRTAPKSLYRAPPRPRPCSRLPAVWRGGAGRGN